MEDSIKKYGVEILSATYNTLEMVALGAGKTGYKLVDEAEIFPFSMPALADILQTPDNETRKYFIRHFQVALVVNHFNREGVCFKTERPTQQQKLLIVEPNTLIMARLLSGGNYVEDAPPFLEFLNHALPEMSYENYVAKHGLVAINKYGKPEPFWKMSAEVVEGEVQLFLDLPYLEGMEKHLKQEYGMIEEVPKTLEEKINAYSNGSGTYRESSPTSWG